MTKMTYLNALTFATTSFALVACSADAPQSSAAQQQNSPTTVAAAKQQPSNNGWIEAAQKHNNSGLSMRYRVDGELAVGKPVTIALEFSGARDAGAQVSMLPAKALSMGSSGGMQKQGDAFVQALKSGQVNAQSITVTPTSEGAHFISMQLSQNGQTSASGIMLRVGQAGQLAETMGQAVTTESGEKLIVMPAK